MGENAWRRKLCKCSGNYRTYICFKNDGSLWYSGEGNAEGLKQDSSLPALRSISSDGYLVVALTVDGDLFIDRNFSSPMGHN